MPKNEHDSFVHNLRALRKEKGMTQDDLASVLDVSRTSVSGYERGDRKPEFGKLIEIADIFNVSIDELFGRNKKERDPVPFLDSKTQLLLTAHMLRETAINIEKLVKEAEDV